MSSIPPLPAPSGDTMSEPGTPALPAPAGHAGAWFATAERPSERPDCDALDSASSPTPTWAADTARASARAEANSGDPTRTTTHSATSHRLAHLPEAMRRGLPRMPAWGPMESSLYGLTSTDAEIAAARALLAQHQPVAIVTGAGMSTDSGLPDYRGRTATARQPMTIQEFRGSDLSRRRYWARSTVGWEQFRIARPNRGHDLLAQIQRAESPFAISAVITQNVDGLHEAADTRNVITLHGALNAVTCLACDHRSSRQQLHSRLLAMNPSYRDRLQELADNVAQAPDGDADVDRTADFRYPVCGLCGGMLKPDVIFFGETARPEMVDASYQAVAQAGSLLVLGSSLTVQSGLRFVRAAARQGKPVVVVNDGPTRADQLAQARIHGSITDVLAAWLRAED